jgi:hypothetical protein
MEGTYTNITYPKVGGEEPWEILAFIHVSSHDVNNLYIENNNYKLFYSQPYGDMDERQNASLTYIIQERGMWLDTGNIASAYKKPIISSDNMAMEEGRISSRVI